ncbi:HDOD domain-containing protein [Streptomyces sp. MBT49]|uniref:HD-GYP domain-containing protein n=1 Tax=Streptomyces sp. MBT49 TaxID=1488380 RepID=UPI0019097066|nr:HD domain-containing protein [Streptomyces sp. MBT49]MBK3623890.1 HDOD domain-containing protein [Streptomyces sp. MBT49]
MTARRSPLALHAVAGLLVAGSLLVTFATGVEERPVALAFGVLVAVGELARPPGGPPLREAAPLGAAGSLAYALVGAHAGHPTHHGVAQALLVLTVLCDTVVVAVLARSRTGWPFAPTLRDELRGLPGIGSAVCATGAVMALAVAVVGLWALPVFSVPLLLTQLSLRRHAAVRATYRQTIASLARATEIAGYTPAGHARRVAALSQAVGRDLGLPEPELTVLEYAALMHDIGQLSLVDPVPDGATAGLPAAQQRRIALLGGAVVRQTGADARVAAVVERQADPYPEQPPAARIVRVVNAYEEKARGRGPGGPLAALEELRLGTGREYAPEVVEALAGVLRRTGAQAGVHPPASGPGGASGRVVAGDSWAV